MLARRHVLVILVLSLAVIFSIAFVADAQQQQPITCPVIVSDSLTALGTNCATLSRNTSCYGHDKVQHTAFTQSEPPTFYTAPGDHADLSVVATMQTGPFNLEQQLWGLNVMDVNANLPYALSPKGVIYVQFGGVEVESAVEPASAVTLLETGISISSSSQTNLLTWPSPSIPGHASDVVMSVPAGASLSVDAIDPAGDFVRAVYSNHVGWVAKSALDSSVDLSTLPTIGPNDMTDLQGFYFRTGIGDLAGGVLPCAQAPSLLFIQGPNNAAADIQVFQTPVRIDSTIILRSIPGGDQLGTELELIDLTGLAIVYPDTPDQILIPPGFKTTIPLCSDFESLGIEGDADEKATCGKWSTPVPLTQDELNELTTVQDIPCNVLDYCPIVIPIIVHASGVGNVNSQLVFPNQAALDAARHACTLGELPAYICAYLGV